MTKFYVGEFVHQVGPLPRGRVKWINNDRELATHLECHRGPAITIGDGQLVLRMSGEAQFIKVEDRDV